MLRLRISRTRWRFSHFDIFSHVLLLCSSVVRGERRGGATRKHRGHVFFFSFIFSFLRRLEIYHISTLIINVSIELYEIISRNIGYLSKELYNNIYK